VTGKMMITKRYKLPWMHFTLNATEEQTECHATERYSNNNNNNHNNNHTVESTSTN
jgi:hypothetical protein